VTWELVLASLLAPFLGAAVPVLLGAVFLKRQKREERINRLHDEKRLVYAQFIEVYADFIVKRTLESEKNIVTVEAVELQRLLKAIAQVSLYAPPGIVDEVQKAFPHEGKQVSPAAIARMMREDLRA
jgi:hypothetical protein